MLQRRFRSHDSLMISIVALGLLPACATNFTGAAHFPGGVSGCSTRCSEQGLKAAAFVYAGNYSTACVCQSKIGTTAPLVSSDVSADSALASDAVPSDAAVAASSVSAAEEGKSGEISGAGVEPARPPTAAPATGVAPLRGGPVNSGAAPVALRGGSGRRGQ